MLIASDVMSLAASLLNDTAQTVFTNQAQLPYLNMAIGELNLEMEQNNVAATNATSSEIIVPAGILGLGDGGQPGLPIGIVEIQQLHERTAGSSEDFQEMTRCEFLPLYDQQWQSLIYWSYENQLIKFLGATSARGVKIQYIADRIIPVVDPANPINIINAKMPLVYRTAGLCAEFIGENPTRAASLNSNAAGVLGIFMNINTKSKQAIMTRRRPFMSTFKSRGGW